MLKISSPSVTENLIVDGDEKKKSGKVQSRSRSENISNYGDGNDNGDGGDSGRCEGGGRTTGVAEAAMAVVGVAAAVESTAAVVVVLLVTTTQFRTQWIFAEKIIQVKSVREVCRFEMVGVVPTPPPAPQQQQELQ